MDTLQRITNKFRLHGFIASFIIFAIAIILFIYNINKSRGYLKMIKLEYPSVGMQEELNYKITNIFHGNEDIVRNDPNHAYLTLDNRIKVRITTGFEPFNQLRFDDIIDIGDIIKKQPLNDTIKILKVNNKDTVIYYFQLRDDQGYPLKQN